MAGMASGVGVGDWILVQYYHTSGRQPRVPSIILLSETGDHTVCDDYGAGYRHRNKSIAARISRIIGRADQAGLD